MRLDSHIHAEDDRSFKNDAKAYREGFLKALENAGLKGGAVFSVDPLQFPDWEPQKRLSYVMDLCKGSDYLFPFYYIDPTADSAKDEVDMAVQAGVSGFKMICSNYKVSDKRCMEIVSEIASKGKPVIFHSGICWDGMNSAENNRPGNFEALIDIPKLKFCLAHVSWPWYDECIAVYGKFNNAYSMRPDLSCEMFIDVTPGTPRLYRREVFTRMLKWSEYDFRYNLMFGTDCNSQSYNTKWSLEWQSRDDELYRELIEEDIEDFLDHVYCRNLLRFVGKSSEIPKRKIPLVAQ